LLNPIIGILASSGGFEPTSIAGLKLWLDAADTSTISLSGSNVTQWNDKSGNGYNFAQGTAANRPSSGTRTQNGLNVIDFDGTNDFLPTTAAKSAFNFLNNTTATLFLVLKNDSTTGVQWMFGNNGGSNAQIGILSYNSGTNFISRNGNGSGTWTYDITVAGNTTNAKYLTYKSDPANATAANRIKLALDNGAFSGANTETQAASASDSTRDFSIGDAASPDTGIPMDGFICEFLIYDTILSNDDITNVQTYLSGKWAI
jgi:hypothetical protein